MMYELNHHQRHHSLGDNDQSLDKLLNTTMSQQAPPQNNNYQQPFAINIKLLLKDPALMTSLASGDIGI